MNRTDLISTYIYTVFNLGFFRRYMAKILPIRRKTLFNQSFNLVFFSLVRLTGEDNSKAFLLNLFVALFCL